MKRQKKKEKIIEAAGYCFMRFGFEKTTMEDIGKYSGLNKASLYYYYKSKESIFADVILNERGDYLKALKEKVEQAQSHEEKIMIFVVERYKSFQKTLHLNQLSVDIFRKVKSALQPVYKSVVAEDIEYLTSLLDSGVKAKEFVPCDSGRIARTILTVSDAIKNKEMLAQGLSMDLKKVFSRTEKEVSFTLSLIMDGIRKKKKQGGRK